MEQVGRPLSEPAPILLRANGPDGERRNLHCTLSGFSAFSCRRPYGETVNIGGTMATPLPVPACARRCPRSA